MRTVPSYTTSDSGAAGLGKYLNTSLWTLLSITIKLHSDDKSYTATQHFSNFSMVLVHQNF